jgi:uncharacterized YccA/Bax inhibitor family protein
MRTSNPALKDEVFEIQASVGESAMTIQGTVTKAFILIGIIIFSGAISWAQYAQGGPAMILTIGGAIFGFILAMITIFKKEWSPVTAPLYAFCEGLFLGGVSAMYNAAYNGIVSQAVMLTIGTFIALLLAYRSGLIKATENFKLGIFAATGAIGIFYLIAMGMAMFGAQMPLLHDNGILGIGLSLVIVVVAALNLVLDFDFIEKGAENNAPKYMEWYASFGLIVTLVWLYLEILRLLSKLNRD